MNQLLILVWLAGAKPVYKTVPVCIENSSRMMNCSFDIGCKAQSSISKSKLFRITDSGQFIEIVCKRVREIPKPYERWEITEKSR